MSREKTSLLIRADAGTRMGTGHVMRCLALAQAWQDAGGIAVLASAELPDALAERCRSENVQVVAIDAAAGSADGANRTCELAREIGANWIVLDGYQFPAEFRAAIKSAGLSLLWIDDLGTDEPPHADIILNQNLHADESLYPRRRESTKPLLGPRYALLRREFRPWRDWSRPASSTTRKLLVTLGGSDPDDHTTRVLEALREVPLTEWQVEVVLGPGNPHRDSLLAAAERCPFPVRILERVRDMSRLMREADAAIAACGSTCWELLFFDVPTAAVAIADNQLPSANRLADQKLMTIIGARRDDLAGELREFFTNLPTKAGSTTNRPRLVDGRGAQRAVRALGLDVLDVRSAVAEDSRDVWECSNDLSARAVSINPAPIPWSDHENWYAARLRDSDCLFLVATANDGEFVGHCRCQLDDEAWVISISLRPGHRGKGYGVRLIRQTVERLFAQRSAESLDAYIRLDNPASRKAFEKAGFESVGLKNIRGVEMAHYVIAPACGEQALAEKAVA
ncbi:MAG: UDP-2,4-diacetamido-2,4,6-trideoxy-beta-L-altropyranose hydrolase [Planctomycetaceae bacterium]